MDPAERCTCCDAVFDEIHEQFKMDVSRASKRSTQGYCVGFIDVNKISRLYPVDVLTINHTMQSLQTEGRLCLVVFWTEKHGMCLGILHESTTTELKAVKPPPATTWQRGEPRVCLCGESVIADAVSKVAGGKVVYTATPGTNLGRITCQDVRSYPMFDITAWIHELDRMTEYSIHGIWCYLNSSISDHSFAVEVVTGSKQLEEKSKIDGIDFPRKKTVFGFWEWCLVIIMFTIMLVAMIKRSWDLL